MHAETTVSGIGGICISRAAKCQEMKVIAAAEIRDPMTPNSVSSAHLLSGDGMSQSHAVQFAVGLFRVADLTLRRRCLNAAQLNGRSQC